MALDCEVTAFRTLMRVGLVAALVAGLSACETSREVVDTVNPVKWFEDDAPETAEADKDPNSVRSDAVPGAEADYPKLGAVPNRPAEPAIKREYAQVQSGLVADKENARYTDERLRREEPPERVKPKPSASQTANAGAEVMPSELPEDPPEATGITPPSSTDEVPALKPQPYMPSTDTSSAATPTVAPQPAAPRAAPEPEPLAETTRTAPKPEATEPPPPPADLSDKGEDNATQGEQKVATGHMQQIAIVYFPQGGSKLTDHDRNIIGQVAQIFRQRNGKRLAIIGHSSTKAGERDPQKNALVNYKVSLDRATAVAQALVEAGVSRERIALDARGAKELKFSEANENGEAGNRRAEIFINF